MDDRTLIKEALIAREASYSPYSHFAVGAALLTKDGKIYRGCNIENASYTPTNCAERTAFFKAVSENVRDFSKIAIVGGDSRKPIDSYAFPCGVCRQVMREFCDLDKFEVIVAISEEKYIKKTLGDLFPDSFGPEDL